MPERTPEWDGYARIHGRELLAKHRAAEINRGDIVRAICTLEERVAELEAQLGKEKRPSLMPRGPLPPLSVHDQIAHDGTAERERERRRHAR